MDTDKLQGSLDAEVAEIEAMTNGRLLESLLNLSFHIGDAERQHNFDYAKRHRPRYALLFNEVKRRMEKL